MTSFSGRANIADTMSGCTALCPEHPDRRCHTEQSSMLPVPARHRIGFVAFIMASNVPPAMN
jgi:hypothetical protein